MGLSTKQVSGDQGLDWGQTFLQSAPVETSKPPPPLTRRQQPQQQQPEPLKCPRCASSNTKFCYYNNYNKSQPRHFCKSCKRHWTKGGTLRNVPAGGGRKNKRPKAPRSAPPSALRHQDLPTTSAGGGQKNMSNLLYHALIGRSSSPLMHHASKGFDNISISTSSNAAAPPPQLLPNSEFHLSSLTNFDMNASLNPSSYESLNAFDHFAGNLDSMEESSITTVNIPGCSGGAWAGPDSSSTLDLPSYWNWNDLTSSDLSISWEDEENKAAMKP